MMSLGQLIDRYDVPGPRYTSYPTVPVWSDDFGPNDHAAALARAAADTSQPLALYVHLPFCEHRCLFCGCNVIITRKRDRADHYLDVLAAEADLVAKAMKTPRPVAAMHWGGGTPTFLREDQLERAHGIVASRFGFLPDAELSIEIDPRVTSVSQLETLRRLGFNRVSMGVQDFDPVVQETIGRIQPLEATAKLIEAARNLGFAGVNFDLIYGLARQTPERWARTIETVVSLSPDRIATYAFAHVPNIKPHQRRLPLADIPRGETKLSLYLYAKERFERAGYVAVGMDHFARYDDPLAQAATTGTLYRNFQGYTTDPPGALIGLGVSSISDAGGTFAQNEAQLGRYVERIQRGELATIRGIRRSDDDDLRREIIRRIMCDFTVDLDALGDARVFADEIAALAPLAEDGLVEVAGAQINVTERGRPFVRNVAMHFDAYLGDGGTFSRTV